MNKQPLLLGLYYKFNPTDTFEAAGRNMLKSRSNTKNYQSEVFSSLTTRDHQAQPINVLDRKNKKLVYILANSKIKPLKKLIGLGDKSHDNNFQKETINVSQKLNTGMQTDRNKLQEKDKINCKSLETMNSIQSTGDESTRLRTYRYQSINAKQIKRQIQNYRSLETQRSKLKKPANTHRVLRKKNGGQGKSFEKLKSDIESKIFICENQKQNYQEMKVCSAREPIDLKKGNGGKSLLLEKDINYHSNYLKMNKKNRRLLTQMPKNHENEAFLKRKKKIKKEIHEQVSKKQKSTPPKDSKHSKAVSSKSHSSYLSSIMEARKQNLNSANVSQFHEQSILQNIKEIDFMLHNVENKMIPHKTPKFQKKSSQYKNRSRSKDSNKQNVKENSRESAKEIKQNGKDKKIKRLKNKTIMQSNCFCSLNFLSLPKNQAVSSRRYNKLGKVKSVSIKSFDKIKSAFPKGFFQEHPQ